MAKLYFYYSAMNAGKSTNLLQSSYNYIERGMDTILFTPKLDDRVKVGTIASRIGLESNAYPFMGTCNLYDYVVEQRKDRPRIRCVLVDEAQFLSKAQVLQLVDVVDKLKIPVLTYGLRTDFMGEVFEGSQYLLGYAEELVEIKTVCYCGRKATMNLRIDDQGNALVEGDQVEIGGNERYIAACRIHYFEATNKAREKLAQAQDA